MHPPSAHSNMPSDGLAVDVSANDPRRWLSALADGQADAAEPACGLWRDDAAARQTWHAYHLIGDVLRSEDLAREPGRDAAFLAGLRAKLAAEPVVLAPMTAAPRERARQPWLLPAAAAAGFVAVAGVLEVLRLGTPGAGSRACRRTRAGFHGGEQRPGTRGAVADRQRRLHPRSPAQ